MCILERNYDTLAIKRKQLKRSHYFSWYIYVTFIAVMSLNIILPCLKCISINSFYFHPWAVSADYSISFLTNILMINTFYSEGFGLMQGSRSMKNRHWTKLLFPFIWFKITFVDINNAPFSSQTFLSWIRWLLFIFGASCSNPRKL